MHPYAHVLLTTLAAAALRQRLGRRALAFWAGGVLADSDHLLWHARHAGRLDPIAAWRHFAGAAAGVRPTRPLLLHSWRFIAASLALAPISPWIGASALGFAFHRLLDDLDSRFGPWWRGLPRRRRHALHQAVFRRAGYRCESCGAIGTKLEAHHRVQRETGGKDRLDNLIALCVACHDRAHGRLPSGRSPSRG